MTVVAALLACALPAGMIAALIGVIASLFPQTRHLVSTHAFVLMTLWGTAAILATGIVAA